MKNAVRGFLEYRVLPRIMDRHPTADGFVLLNDDVALNYWTPALQNADLNKFWFLGKNHPELIVTELRTNGTVPQQPWYIAKGAREQMRKAYEDMEGEERRTFLESVQGVAERSGMEASNLYLKAIADVYYVPRRHVAGFKRLVRVLWKRGVWSEVSSFGFWVFGFGFGFRLEFRIERGESDKVVTLFFFGGKEYDWRFRMMLCVSGIEGGRASEQAVGSGRFSV